LDQVKECRKKDQGKEQSQISGSLPGLRVQFLNIRRNFAGLKRFVGLSPMNQARFLRLGFGADMTIVLGHRRGTLSQSASAFDNLFLNFRNDDLEIEIPDIGPAQSLYAVEIITKIFERLSAGDFFPDVSQLFE
jgi:hypothetical protein